MCVLPPLLQTVLGRVTSPPPPPTSWLFNALPDPPPLLPVYPVVTLAAAHLAGGLMDSGCTHVLLTENDAAAPCFTPHTTHTPILVRFPNGTTASSTASGTLTANRIVLPAWVMRTRDIRDSLIAHAPFTHAGCTVVYDDTCAYVRTRDGKVAISGRKAPGNTSWRVDVYDINPTGVPFSMLQPAPVAAPTSTNVADAAVVHRYESVQERVNHATALLGSAPKETVLRALRRGYLPWLPCTTAQYAAHAIDGFATYAGHFRELRAGQRSTKPALPVFPVPEPVVLPAPPAWWSPTPTAEHTDDAVKPLPTGYAVIRPIPQPVQQTLFADTKYKHRPSYRGDTHELVLVYNNYTHVERCKESATAIADAYKRALDWFDAHADPNLAIDFVRIDNATSQTLRDAIAARTRVRTGQPLQLSYVAVGMHRANRAEKAIQDFESAELSTFATAAHDYPRDYWPELLPQVELVHNHLKPWALDPSISAWHGLHGRRYDFNTHPLTVAGARIYAQIDKIHRDPPLPYKAKAGWYLGPSLDHHRCARLLMPTKGERQCRT